MLSFLNATSRNFVDVPVCVQRWELLSLTSAAGFEVHADAHTLWITADHESNDIFLSPGERFRIGAHRRVLISADHPETVVVSGKASRATRIEVIRANGERERAYPRNVAPDLDEPQIVRPPYFLLP